jgi:hypothetical protein
MYINSVKELEDLTVNDLLTDMSGWISINIKVEGFWSSNSLTLYVKRRENWRDEGTPAKWEFEISRSSGGRDPKEVEDDLVASTNYAYDMLKLVDFARSLNVEELEARHQYFVAKWKEKNEAEKKEAQSKFDADSVMTEAQAKVAVARLVGEEGIDRMNVRLRGKDSKIAFAREETYTGRITLRKGGQRISRMKLVEELLSGKYSNEYEVYQ